VPQAVSQGQFQPQPLQREAYRGGGHHDDYHGEHGYNGKHKRKSFLAELFD
jgi:hypothetical protein